MEHVGHAISVRLSKRMCLSCGFDGRGIQSDHRDEGWACPRCGSDLYSRPPRSYAELEGFGGVESAAGVRAARGHAVPAKAERIAWMGWLATGVALGLAILGLGVLLGAAI